MSTEKDILIVEPFNGGSHGQLIKLLQSDLEIGHRSVLVSLPAKKWHWRARTSALYLSQTIPYSKSYSYRVLFTSSVLNLAELVALRPDLATLKKIVYFHENQLVYPVRKMKDRDFQYGYNQIVTSLVADVVVFNSAFNMESFLSSISRHLKLIPDHRPKDLEAVIRPKCRVMYFPITIHQNSANRIHSFDTVSKDLHSVDTKSRDVYSVDTKSRDVHPVDTTSRDVHSVDTTSREVDSMDTTSRDMHSVVNTNSDFHSDDTKNRIIHYVSPSRDDHSVDATKRDFNSCHTTNKDIHSSDSVSRDINSVDTTNRGIQYVDTKNRDINFVYTTSRNVYSVDTMKFNIHPIKTANVYEENELSAEQSTGSEVFSQGLQESDESRIPSPHIPEIPENSDSLSNARSHKDKLETANNLTSGVNCCVGDNNPESILGKDSHLQSKNRIIESMKGKESCLHIVWPHRWEHDKGPESFFKALLQLQSDGFDFVVSVIGETFTDVPEVFELMKPQLADRILAWGYQTRQDYLRIVNSADVVVSTALHEFFGVAMLEATGHGCYPLCPKRLVYPEIYPVECLYATQSQLVKRLKRFCQRPSLARTDKFKVLVDKFSWENLQGEYRKLLLE